MYTLWKLQRLIWFLYSKEMELRIEEKMDILFTPIAPHITPFHF